MTLALALLLSGPAVAQDRVHLELDWPEDSRWRVVESWRVETAAAGGGVAVRSGVVKGTWAVDHADGGVALELRDPMAARITPRNDPRTRALAARVLQPWRRTVVAPPTPEAPPSKAPLPDDASAPAPAEEPAEAAPAPSAPAEPVAAGQPSAAPVVAVPGPPSDPLVAALEGDPYVRFDRLAAELAGRSVVIGAPERIEDLASGDVVTVSARPLAWCPDLGPGSTCVELVVVRASGGAPLEGEVTAGARSAATWVVEPATLLPHGGRIETVVAGGAESAARQVVATREITLLPPVQPAPLAPAP